MTANKVTITRHDFSLLVIAVVFLAGLAVAHLFSIQLFQSMFVSSVPASLCVGYVLFYNPPDGTAAT